jgi:hypothetical protein
MSGQFYDVTFDAHFTELGVITWQQRGRRAIRAKDERGAMVDVARSWPEGWRGKIEAREITDLLELARFGVYCGAADDSLLAFRERAERAVSLTGTQAWITEAEAVTAEAERKFQRCAITPSPSPQRGLTATA